MTKIYLLAVAMLLGAVAMQAQTVGHQTSVSKTTEFEQIQMDGVNGGDAVEATAAERAQAKLKAAPATGEAYYYRPAGALFLGIAGTTTYAQRSPILAVSPYKKYTFKAQEADSYNWSFQIGGNWYSAAAQNVSVTYNFEIDSVPSLTVGETEYHVFGNQNADNPHNGYSRLYSVPRPSEWSSSTAAGSYYASPKYMALRNRDNTGGGTFYYTGSTIGYDGGTGYWFGYNTRGWNAMATYVEAPQHAYVLNGGAIRYNALAWVDETAENVVPITIDVYAVTNHEMDSLALGEKLTSATYELTNTTPASGGFAFQFPEPLVVDQEIALIARGYDNEALKGFTLYISRDTWDEGHGQHGYMVHVNTEGTPTQTLGLKNFFSNTDLGVTAPSILLDVSLPFMRYYYNSVENPTFEFSPEGECVSEAVGTYDANVLAIWAADPSENWTVTGTEPQGAPQIKAADGGGVPEWITYSIEDNYGTDGEYSYLSTMTVNVAENNTLAARSAILTISQPAAGEVTLNVVQQAGTTGIAVVDAAKTVESVTYYNLAGVESNTPFQGVNIEVKKYNDGSKTTSKVVR